MKLVVRRKAVPHAPHLARLHVGQNILPAAIGKTGITHHKREGDGASPAGCFYLKPGFFRGDRLKRPMGAPDLRSLRRSQGWCDDAASQSYNRPVPAGSPVRHERLWRDDEVYDVVFPTSHNQRPRVLGAGSAIFLHLARPGYRATEGCVAVSLTDLRRLLPRLARNARLLIVG